jgi:hypothetical protein
LASAAADVAGELMLGAASVGASMPLGRSEAIGWADVALAASVAAMSSARRR